MAEGPEAFRVQSILHCQELRKQDLEVGESADQDLKTCDVLPCLVTLWRSLQNCPAALPPTTVKKIARSGAAVCTGSLAHTGEVFPSPDKGVTERRGVLRSGF